MGLGLLGAGGFLSATESDEGVSLRAAVFAFRFLVIDFVVQYGKLRSDAKQVSE